MLLLPTGMGRGIRIAVYRGFLDPKSGKPKPSSRALVYLLAACLLARHRRNADGDGGEWRIRITSRARQAFSPPLCTVSGDWGLGRDPHHLHWWRSSQRKSAERTRRITTNLAVVYLCVCPWNRGWITIRSRAEPNGKGLGLSEKATCGMAVSYSPGPDLGTLLPFAGA